MRRGGQIAFGLFVLGLLALLGASLFYRIVRTPWGTVVLEKPHPSLGGSYVDTRNWEARDFIRRWDLSKQLMQRGLQHLPTAPAGPSGTGAAATPKQQEQKKEK